MRDIQTVKYCNVMFSELLTATTDTETKAELTKKMEATNLSLDRRGFSWFRFIMLFMVSSCWHSLFTEHHASLRSLNHHKISRKFSIFTSIFDYSLT